MVFSALLRSFGRRPYFSDTSALLKGNAKYLTAPKWKRICLTATLPKEENDTVTVTFVTCNGRSTVSGKVGDTLLDLHNNYSMDLPGYGNCGGTMSCSTCLVVLSEEHYEKSLDGDMSAENDMIDLSGSLEMTSRLGCQVKLTKALEGMVVTVPSVSKDLREATAS